MKIDYIPRYTYEDYVNWEGRWELIDGLPYAMSPLPSINHQKMNSNINIQLAKLLENCEHCTALLPVDWRIDKDTVVQPDNSVVCKEVSGQYLSDPPCLIFEILSPSTAYKDKNIKYQIYEAQGVKYYVLIDILTQTAIAYHLMDGHYEIFCQTGNESISFHLEPCDIIFDFAKIWLG